MQITSISIYQNAAKALFKLLKGSASVKPQNIQVVRMGHLNCFCECNSTTQQIKVLTNVQNASAQTQTRQWRTTLGTNTCAQANRIHFLIAEWQLSKCQAVIGTTKSFDGVCVHEWNILSKVETIWLNLQFLQMLTGHNGACRLCFVSEC